VGAADADVDEPGAVAQGDLAGLVDAVPANPVPPVVGFDDDLGVRAASATAAAMATGSLATVVESFSPAALTRTITDRRR
jgi:hypothetical protein